MEGNICEFLVFLDALLTAELPSLFKNRGLFAACSEEPPQVGPAFERGRKSWPFCPCLELGGRQTIATFPVHNFKSWVSCVIARFTEHKRVVMTETKHFKALNRFNVSKRSERHTLVTPAGQIGNATVEMQQKLRPNMHKTTFYKAIATASLRVKSFKCS